MPKRKAKPTAAKPPTTGKKQPGTNAKKTPTKSARPADIKSATPPAPPPLSKAAEQYEARKARERERQAAQVRAGSDVGPIPAVVDPELRSLVCDSFREFCERVFPQRFGLEWSADHLEVIAKIESCILHGRLYALAMPRGSGKSTLVECAILWAILTGRRRYVALIGADKPAAMKMLAAIKSELENNEKLFELFPEVCHPIRKLEGKPNKCLGQTFNGHRTHVAWKGPAIVLPSIAESVASGAILEAVGILGRIRGMKFARPDGDNARPDLFVLDDPQTDRSAKYRGQVTQRLNIITGAVLGLAGPDTDIAGFATVTVIEKDDVADQLLDREKFQDWQGYRYKLVYAWPTNKNLWDEYANLRMEGLRIDGSIHRATEFYRANQAAMDKGAKVAWPARKKADLSAIQHAYNLRLQSPDTFDAEFQNTPKTEASEIELLTPLQLEEKTHGFGRAVLPPDADLITGFVDVQQKMLYWMICAWQSHTFSGWVLDYGTWPKQRASYFTLRQADITLATVYKKMRIEARWRQGLFDLLDAISQMRFTGPPIETKSGVESGAVHSLRPQMIGIDAAYGPSTKIVQSVAMEHPKAAWLMPFFGRTIEATGRPMAEWQQKKGERKGNNWILRPTNGGGHHSLADVNHWKSFVHAGLNTPLGDPGCISFFRPEMRTGHKMLAEHLRAESVMSVTANGRTVEKWILPPSKPDNHFLDCLSGSAIMASILGANLQAHASRTQRRSKPRPRRPTRIVA